MKRVLVISLVLAGCGDFSEATFGDDSGTGGMEENGGTNNKGGSGGLGGNNSGGNNNGGNNSGGVGGTSNNGGSGGLVGGTSNNGGIGGQAGNNNGGTGEQEVDCMGSNLFCKEFEYCDKNSKCRDINGPCSKSLGENKCDLFTYEYTCVNDENIRKAFEKQCWEFAHFTTAYIGFCCPKEMKEGGQPPPKVDCTDCKPTQFCNIEKNKCENKCSLYQINGQNVSNLCSNSSFEYLCPMDWDGLEKAGCTDLGELLFTSKTFCCKYKY